MKADGLRAFLRAAAERMAEKKDWLIELDSRAGDSDLGLTMSDGFAAAAKAAGDSDLEDIGKLAYTAGKAMASAVPSTMGTLMASGLMQAGKVLKGKEELDAQGEAAFFEAYFDGVQQRGKAKVGEKTFLDGLWPAAESLKAAAEKGRLTAEDAENAAAAAEQAFENTKGMKAVHGRMAIRGEASRELYDPGAAVAMLLMRAYADTKKA